MNVLIIGSGGRESAFAHAIKKSNLLTTLFVAPGNGGTAKIAENVNLQENDFEGISHFCKQNKIGLILIGPEVPLVNGIRDFLEKDIELKDLLIIGPGKIGAQLEGSKAFSKEFMFKYKIPTAAYKTFNELNINESDVFLESLSPPYVLKADGPAAGKGVLIIDNLIEAKKELREMILDKKFGESSSQVVIEEFLSGTEVSMFVLTDGESYVILPEAKDYKRIGNNDIGPNTGGMGAVSPVYFADKNFTDNVIQQIINPTIKGLKNENISYKGFIFFGLINCEGNPKVIEYNCRMGDPETEAVLPRIKSDFLKLLINCGTSNLRETVLDIDNRTSLTVVLASGGYPAAFEKGYPISGLENVEHSLIFEAGTKTENNVTTTNGGRVLALTSLASDINQAREKIYYDIEKINYTKKYFRTDIGKDLIN
ncbi:MAG: phosphoribosylamine--glycine ligase [Bacteroidota bacterium]